MRRARNTTAAIIAVGLTTLASVKARADKPAQVVVQWGDNGLSSVRFGDHDYLAFGEFNLGRAELSDAQGKSHPVSLQGETRVDPNAQTMTTSYTWGSFQTKAQPQNNVLKLTITVTNTSAEYIDGLSFEPMRLRFDEKPKQYDGSIPILADNISQPGVVLMSTSHESVVLAADDPSKPLGIGFPWAINKPVSTEFPIRIVIGREPMYPDRTPAVKRRIAPGKTDIYRLSLTFGEAHQNSNDLLTAVYERCFRSFAPTLDWKDRRPIGAIMLATANAGFPGNPRGWFLDRSLNVAGKVGVDLFRAKLMKLADTSISILRQMNAQGAITWDIEGEEYAHPGTYIGDPRLIDTLDPEMSNCADEYFKRFRDAGFRVGLTIRPQQLVRSSDGRRVSQQEVDDPVQILNDKISYARRRWGATLFYIDSNGDPNYPFNWNILREVSLKNPGVLLIPEHSSFPYYAFSAPYGELRGGVLGTSAAIHSIYPNGFRVISTTDGPLLQLNSDLRKSVRSGDILMFRAWFDDPRNVIVRAITDGVTANP